MFMGEFGQIKGKEYMLQLNYNMEDKNFKQL